MDNVYKWLELALDIGIKEREFWDMTLAEFVRAIESDNRVTMRKEQEKAIYDYQLAYLIGRHVACNFSKTAQIPEIYDVYPGVFNKDEIEEKRQERQDALSAIRFQQFANSFNQKFQEGGNT